MTIIISVCKVDKTSMSKQKKLKRKKNWITISCLENPIINICLFVCKVINFMNY